MHAPESYMDSCFLPMQWHCIDERFLFTISLHHNCANEGQIHGWKLTNVLEAVKNCMQLNLS